MAQQGASLQTYNNELVKCLEDLREKREQVNKAILKEEKEKSAIQKQVTAPVSVCLLELPPRTVDWNLLFHASLEMCRT